MNQELLREIIRRELTQRQQQVVELLLDRHSVSETARILGVHPSTVTRIRDRAYIRIYRCLGYTIGKRALDKHFYEE